MIEASSNDQRHKSSVLVVILNWNGYPETLTAVESVLGMDYPNFRVLLVDNGSTDDSVRELGRVVSDRVEMIETGSNTGYTGGCNIGLRRGMDGGFDYVWLLNNDAVAERDTLRSLVRAADADERIGLISPTIAALVDRSELTFSGAYFSAGQKRYDVTHDPAIAETWTAEHPGEAVLIGTALLVRTAMVREVGLMDPALFAYWEDIDFSVRSNRAGFRNVVDRASIVYHEEKRPEMEPLTIKPHYWYYMARNESRFWKKHVGLVGSLRPRLWSFHRFLKHMDRCWESSVSTGAILAGLWHGWLGRGGPYRNDYRMPSAVQGMVRMYGRRRGLLRG